MAAMECKAFLGQLDSWMEGVRPAEARAHVASCRACRSLADDFSAITAAAQTMAADPSEPPAYLWNSIRAQLTQEGIIREAHASVGADCAAFVDQLDAWVEGIRPAEARKHLDSCEGCRRVADDFSAIAVAARTMADDSEPPARLWSAIRAQLEREGIIRGARPVAIAESPRPWRRWFGLPRPAFAGAFATAVILAGLAVRGPLTQRINDYRWMQGTQQSTAPLTAQLDTVEHATVISFRANPVVEAALHKNLAIVDNYIALCEKSVREDPQSEMARDFLYDAYQQKADLLAQMSEQGE